MDREKSNQFKGGMGTLKRLSKSTKRNIYMEMVIAMIVVLLYQI